MPKIIVIKCQDDSPSFDQTLRAIVVVHETDAEWIGRRFEDYDAGFDIKWPKFAWKRVLQPQPSPSERRALDKARMLELYSWSVAAGTLGALKRKGWVFECERGANDPITARRYDLTEVGLAVLNGAS